MSTRNLKLAEKIYDNVFSADFVAKSAEYSKQAQAATELLRYMLTRRIQEVLDAEEVQS